MPFSVSLGLCSPPQGGCRLVDSFWPCSRGFPLADTCAVTASDWSIVRIAGYLKRFPRWLRLPAGGLLWWCCRCSGSTRMPTFPKTNRRHNNYLTAFYSRCQDRYDRQQEHFSFRSFSIIGYFKGAIVINGRSCISFSGRPWAYCIIVYLFELNYHVIMSYSNKPFSGLRRYMASHKYLSSHVDWIRYK